MLLKFLRYEDYLVFHSILSVIWILFFYLFIWDHFGMAFSNVHPGLLIREIFLRHSDNRVELNSLVIGKMSAN